MNTWRIIDALGDIEDTLVLTVLPEPVKTQKRHWLPLLAAAAVLAICMFGVMQLKPAPTVPAAVEEMVPAPTPTDPELPMLRITPQVQDSGTIVHRYLDSHHLLTGEEELPAALPVYQNAFQVDVDGQPMGWEPNQEKMKQLARQYAAWLHLDGPLEINDEGIWIGDLDCGVKVNRMNTVYLYFNSHWEFPIGTGIQTAEEREQLVQYLLRQYDGLIDMDEPVWSITGVSMDREKLLTTSICFYEEDEAPYFNAALNSCVIFTFSDSGLCELKIRQPLLGPVIGTYPILTPEEALVLLSDGYGFTENSPISEPIEPVSAALDYVNFKYADCFLPYYQFLMPQEDASLGYTAFYVPAVRPEWIENPPCWQASDPRSILSALPDPEQTGPEVRGALVAYFEANPDQWNAHKMDHMELSAPDILICEGPLEQGIVPFTVYEATQSGVTLAKTAVIEVEDLFQTRDSFGEAYLQHLKGTQPNALRQWLECCFEAGELDNAAFEEPSIGTAKFELWSSLLPSNLQNSLWGLTPLEEWFSWLEETDPDRLLTICMKSFLNGDLLWKESDDGSAASVKYKFWMRNKADDLLMPVLSFTLLEYWDFWCREAEAAEQDLGREAMKTANPTMSLYLEVKDEAGT